MSYEDSMPKVRQDAAKIREMRAKIAELEKENEELKAIVAGKTCFADPEAEECGAREMAELFKDEQRGSPEYWMQLWRERRAKK